MSKTFLLVRSSGRSWSILLAVICLAVVFSAAISLGRAWVFAGNEVNAVKGAGDSGAGENVKQRITIELRVYDLDPIIRLRFKDEKITGPGHFDVEPPTYHGYYFSTEPAQAEYDPDEMVQEVIEALENHVDREDWINNGGELASLEVRDHKLYITAPATTHEKVMVLLNSFMPDTSKRILVNAYVIESSITEALKYTRMKMSGQSTIDVAAANALLDELDKKLSSHRLLYVGSSQAFPGMIQTLGHTDLEEREHVQTFPAINRGDTNMDTKTESSDDDDERPTTKVQTNLMVNNGIPVVMVNNVSEPMVMIRDMFLMTARGDVTEDGDIELEYIYHWGKGKPGKGYNDRMLAQTIGVETNLIPKGHAMVLPLMTDESEYIRDRKCLLLVIQAGLVKAGEVVIEGSLLETSVITREVWIEEE